MPRTRKQNNQPPAGDRPTNGAVPTAAVETPTPEAPPTEATPGPKRRAPRKNGGAKAAPRSRSRESAPKPPPPETPPETVAEVAVVEAVVAEPPPLPPPPVEMNQPPLVRPVPVPEPSPVAVLELTQQTEVLKGLLSDVGRDIEHMREQARDQMQQFQDLLQGLNQQRQEAGEGLSQQAEELKGSVVEARQELEQVRGQLRDQVKEARNLFQGLRQERQEAGQELDRLRDQFRGAHQQFVRESVTSSEQVQEAFTALIGKPDEVNRLFQDAAHQVFKDFTAQLRPVYQELIQARELLQSIPREAEEFHQRLTEAKQRLLEWEQIERETAEAREELEELRAEAAEKGSQLTSIQDEQQGTEERLSTAREELERLNEQLREARERLEEARAEVAAAAEPPEPEPANGHVSEGDHNRLGVTVEPGVVVTAVLPGTPAVVAGLAVGDLINSVNGTPVLTGVELRDAIQGMRDGEEITLQVTRGGIAEVMHTRLDPANAEDTAAGRNRLGVTVAPGVVVADVLPETPAWAAYLGRGDVISSVNGAPVLTGEQLRQVVQHLPERAEVLLQVNRGEEAREVQVRLDETPTTR